MSFFISAVKSICLENCFRVVKKSCYSCSMKEEMIFDIKAIANELHYHVSDNELKWRIFQLRVRLDKLEETVNRKEKGAIN
ncbi:Uncharacterised protein [Streptococcus anginosus]|nr:Uncharacterised protein [Streptococcus anginosus]VTS44656.1 Uncharacterised protein [Streptococcus anginosus]